MPIYEYRCRDCGHELEALQKFSDAKLVNCPACHADTLVKKVSAAGFQLKGSGWYVTDFRNGKSGKVPKPEAKEGNGSAGESAKPNGAGSEAKSDTPAKTAESTTKTETPAKPAAAKAESAPAKPAGAPATGNSST